MALNESNRYDRTHSKSFFPPARTKQQKNKKVSETYMREMCEKR